MKYLYPTWHIGRNYAQSYINVPRVIPLEIVRIWRWFHDTCDTIYTTFTKSVETFRTCAIINSKTFSPLHKSYTTFSWGSVVQIPSILRNGSLKYLLLCNPRSFALLYAKKNSDDRFGFLIIRAIRINILKKKFGTIWG